MYIIWEKACHPNGLKDIEKNIRRDGKSDKRRASPVKSEESDRNLSGT